MPFEAMANEISKLTWLKSFNLIQNSPYDSRFIPTSQYYPLTTLSNLEELYVEDYTIPTEILQHFPRIRKTLTFIDSNQYIEFLLKHCPKIEFLRVKDFTVDWLSLVRLTNLKKLRLFPYGVSRQLSIDVSHITRLEELELVMDLERIDGLEYCNNLTNLKIASWFNVSQFTAPPNLEILTLEGHTQDEFSFESFSHLTRLTSLDIECKSVLLRTLGTSLQRLKFTVKTPHNVMDITHLIHLTRLDIRDEKKQFDTHAITSLTNLQNLTLDKSNTIHGGNIFPVNFNGLVNLTRLNLSSVEVDANSLQHMTNLKEFEFLDASLSSEQWQSLNHARNLRVLRIKTPNSEIKYDFTTIDGLPLISLVALGTKENEWQIVTKLTDLQQLRVYLTDDNDLKSLTALSNLTRLHVDKPYRCTTVHALHLTTLTNLQRVYLELITPWYSDEALMSKMTRLYDFEYSYIDEAFVD